MDDRLRGVYIHAAWKMAQQVLRKKGVVAPFTTVHDEEGVVYALPPFAIAQKDLHARRLAALVLQVKAEFVLMVSSAWFAASEDGETITNPSAHPNRQEVVVLQWKARDHSCGAELKRIVRSGKAPSLGSKIPFPLNHPEATNRFFDGLFDIKH